MNSLLGRQIRKNLNDELLAIPEVARFLESVNLSYNNFDDQHSMLQRAMSISSEELFAANQKLIEETKSQKRVIDRLNEISTALSIHAMDEMDKIDEEASIKVGDKLFDYIENQTQKILQINSQRDILLKDLEHQNKELSEYAHMVSHDLKSPLRSISTLTTWLFEDFKEKLGKEGEHTINLILENVEKMDFLIKGILEYSTIGKVELEKYDVDIKNTLDTIMRSVYVPNHVEVKLLDDYPVVQGDKFRMQQLFQNLIVNAIKYNDKEKGEVFIGCKEVEGYWEFQVKDNGKGIDEKYFDKIFQTFQKLENTHNSSGIGLSIVKKIIELYEGRIWLESKMGEGTTFYFTIKK